ncbi:hypothetical protein PanWU01x14_142120 [Parasponia andersonii]|uniref:Uncharacterized protein n=1 Tax=Parasponia andersonii TaxID=3476 RepID=A0A2P5CLT6_PARAD|nr:hypothetical protein PanWU01x14_142120 [Parasponia andersonii]
MMSSTMAMRGISPLPFEEKHSTSPPPLLLSVLGLFDIVLGDRLLELEVYGVYGSYRFSLVLPCFFQDLVLTMMRRERECNEMDQIRAEEKIEL